MLAWPVVSYLNVCCCATTTTPSCVVVTRVLAVVARPAQLLQVEARRQVLCRHRRPPWVGVQQQQWLVVSSNAAGHHVLPFRTDLQEVTNPIIPSPQRHSHYNMYFILICSSTAEFDIVKKYQIQSFNTLITSQRSCTATISVTVKSHTHCQDLKR